MEHGFAKLFRAPEVFAGILHTMGVPAPHLMAWLTILTELVGPQQMLPYLETYSPLRSLACISAASLTSRADSVPFTPEWAIEQEGDGSAPQYELESIQHSIR